MDSLYAVAGAALMMIAAVLVRLIPFEKCGRARRVQARFDNDVETMDPASSYHTPAKPGPQQWPGGRTEEQKQRLVEEPITRV